MKRGVKHRTETRQHGAANDNGDLLESLEPIHIDPGLVAAIDTWVDAQKDPKPSRSEAVSMALYEWATGMGIALHQLKPHGQTLLKEFSDKPDFNKSTSKTLNDQRVCRAIPIFSETTPRPQVGALPIRVNAGGAVEVLLITSRETNRWIIPKGWPMKNRKDWIAAAREAREEAGVIGRSKKRPIGIYDYKKFYIDRYELCRVTVYPLIFDHQCKNWPEKGQREVCWFSPIEAAGRVTEPGLSVILESLNIVHHHKSKITPLMD